MVVLWAEQMAGLSADQKVYRMGSLLAAQMVDQKDFLLVAWMADLRE